MISVLVSNAFSLVSKQTAICFLSFPYFVGEIDSKKARKQSDKEICVIDGAGYTPIFPAHTLETHNYTKFIPQVWRITYRHYGL